MNAKIILAICLIGVTVFTMCAIQYISNRHNNYLSVVSSDTYDIGFHTVIQQVSNDLINWVDVYDVVDKKKFLFKRSFFIGLNDVYFGESLKIDIDMYDFCSPKERENLKKEQDKVLNG